MIHRRGDRVIWSTCYSSIIHAGVVRTQLFAHPPQSLSRDGARLPWFHHDHDQDQRGMVVHEGIEGGRKRQVDTNSRIIEGERIKRGGYTPSHGTKLETTFETTVNRARKHQSLAAVTHGARTMISSACGDASKAKQYLSARQPQVARHPGPVRHQVFSQDCSERLPVRLSVPDGT